MIVDKERVLREVKFRFVRSSGPGGQHVNKVSTKVEASFDIADSESFSEAQKKRLLSKLAARLTNEGILLLTCDEARSQRKNKEIVTERLFQLLIEALKVPKKRKATKPSKAAVEKRLDVKRKTGQKKQERQKPTME